MSFPKEATTQLSLIEKVFVLDANNLDWPSEVRTIQLQFYHVPTVFSTLIEAWLGNLCMVRDRTEVLPDGINRDHVLKAISSFERDGLPEGFKDSHTYYLEHAGKKYPPPAIAALAAYALTGQLPKPGFRAGKGTKCFRVLTDAGFPICRRNTDG